MIRLTLSRAPFYGMALSACFAATFSVSVSAGSLPYTFSAGTSAKAEEVNQNFSHLEQRIQNLEEPRGNVITDGIKTPLTGTVTILSSDTKVVYGTDTLFLTELTEGGVISIEGEAFQIASIDSDTQLTLTSWFGTSVSDVTAYTGDAFLTVQLDKRDKITINDGGYLVKSIQRVTGDDEDKVDADGYVPDRKLVFYKSEKDSSIRITYTDWVETLGSPSSCYYEIKVNRESCSSPEPLRYFNSDQGFSDVLYCETFKEGMLTLEVYAGGCSTFGYRDYISGRAIYTSWSLEAEEVY